MIGALLLIFFASILLVVLYLSIQGMYKRLFPKKEFGAFLCHHKEAAGNLARYMKTQMEKESGATIFLDSDQLEDIELIFDTVRALTANLVILQSKMVLTRPWCAGEIATATSNQIPKIPVTLNDYVVPVVDEFVQMLDSMWSEQQKSHLISYGVDLDRIKEAYIHLNSVPAKILDRLSPIDEQLGVISEVTTACKLTSSISPMSPRSTTKSTKSVTEDKVRICIAGVVALPEPRITCYILKQMIQHQTHVNTEVILEPKSIEPHMSSSDYLVVVLTQGLLTDKAFMEVLYTLEAGRKKEPIELRPMLADQNFNFPGPEYYEELASQGNVGTTLEAGFKRMLSVIALGFNAQASRGIMDQQVTEFCRRLGATQNPMKEYKVQEYEAFTDIGTGAPVSAPKKEESVAPTPTKNMEIVGGNVLQTTICARCAAEMEEVDM
jgi:hypothetical protein